MTQPNIQGTKFNLLERYSDVITIMISFQRGRVGCIIKLTYCMDWTRHHKRARADQHETFSQWPVSNTVIVYEGQQPLDGGT